VSTRAQVPKVRGRRALAIGARVVAGLAVGIVLAEVGFHSRDHGAFPHVNLYAPDAELGVRLRPGESMRLAFGGNPITTVRINQAGFRGEELGAPSADEVVVIGDSQVFGLGVEETQTASAKLQALLPGARVINAGVPTYGPPEYERVLASLLESRHPKRAIPSAKRPALRRRRRRRSTRARRGSELAEARRGHPRRAAAEDTGLVAARAVLAPRPGALRRRGRAPRRRRPAHGRSGVGRRMGEVRARAD
jgi:hypothetical protein